MSILLKSKTIELSGNEVEITCSGEGTAVRNDGNDTVYVSGEPGAANGTDGVVSIPAGSSVVLPAGVNNKLYVNGTGTILVMAANLSGNPFKSSAQTRGSGVDVDARAAINAHAGNAEIHVTSEERAAWNGKAETSDIPTALPANGGNADTVGGKNASDFIYPQGVFESKDLNDILYPCCAVAFNCQNTPENATNWGTFATFAGGSGSFIQLFVETVLYGSTPEMWYRHHNGSVWSEWKQAISC